MNKFNVIYADPPWDYGKTSWILNDGLFRDPECEKKYPTMSNEQLKNLEIDPYGVVYADPPWDYGRDFDAASLGKSRMNVDTHYPTMSNEQLKNLEIDPYGVVYADPPWHFKRDPDAAYPGNPNTTFNLSNQYPTMSNEEISALPIKDIVAKDAACFMWTTDAHMPAALEIMKAWGFTYKTIAFVWIKKEKSGKQVKMLAPWTLKGMELCLLGTRGAMTQHKKDNTVSQIVEAARGRHSQKPLEVAHRIERLFPDLPKIELFARDAKPGWACWGNEVSPDIQLGEELPKIEPKKKVVGLF